MNLHELSITHVYTLKCQINSPPPLINFSIFFQPPDLIRTPRLLILGKLTFITILSFHFLSSFVVFTPNFHGKIACFCIYFSFLLYDNLFLLFPSFYNHVNSLLKFRLPPFILTPHLLNFVIFSDPRVY